LTPDKRPGSSGRRLRSLDHPRAPFSPCLQGRSFPNWLRPVFIPPSLQYRGGGFSVCFPFLVSRREPPFPFFSFSFPQFVLVVGVACGLGFLFVLEQATITGALCPAAGVFPCRSRLLRLDLASTLPSLPRLFSPLFCEIRQTRPLWRAQ